MSQTFYINVDLTTSTGLLKTGKKPNLGSAMPATLAHGGPESTADTPDTFGIHDNDRSPSLPSTPSESDKIQVVGLHTHNPIISYRDQLFSCSWADVIGTELLFCASENDPESHSVRQGKGFDLISASRVKILGQKATLASKSGTQGSSTLNPFNAGQNDQGQGRSQDPTKKSARSSQSDFLKRLKDAKRARGESTLVRRNWNPSNVKRVNNYAGKNHNPQSDAEQDEIEQLQSLVTQGDGAALERLEEIYTANGDEQDVETGSI